MLTYACHSLKGDFKILLLPLNRKSGYDTMTTYNFPRNYLISKRKSVIASNYDRL